MKRLGPILRCLIPICLVGGCAQPESSRRTDAPSKSSTAPPSAPRRTPEIRNRRASGGLLLQVPDLVKVGVPFRVVLKPGTNLLKRVSFTTQGGRYNQYFSPGYTAQDIGISMTGGTLAHDYVAEWDYHRWKLKPVPPGELELQITADNPGRFLMTVTVIRPDGKEEKPKFVIEAAEDVKPPPRQANPNPLPQNRIPQEAQVLSGYIYSL